METSKAEINQTIISTRIFNASIDKMFRAWTEPEHLKNWWGPKGFTNTFNEFDFRPGGKWTFIMHGPDKGNYNNECVFTKIEKPNLIAWNHISKPHFRIVAQFEKVADDKTKVTFKMIFDPSSKEYETIKNLHLKKMKRILTVLKSYYIK